MKKFCVFVEFQEEGKKNFGEQLKKRNEGKKNLNKKQWGGRDAVAGRAQWQLIQNDFCD